MPATPLKDEAGTTSVREPQAHEELAQYLIAGAA